VPQALDVLAVNLDQLQAVAGLRLALMLHVPPLPAMIFHAARAPQQRVVGGQPRQSARYFRSGCRASARSLEQTEIDAADARHRCQPSIRVPDERVGALE